MGYLEYMYHNRYNWVGTRLLFLMKSLNLFCFINNMGTFCLNFFDGFDITKERYLTCKEFCLDTAEAKNTSSSLFGKTAPKC